MLSEGKINTKCAVKYIEDKRTEGDTDMSDYPDRLITKYKKDSQVNYNREKIDDKLYKKIYDENYKLVQTCAFQICENKTEKLQYLEDCMQYGFIELWKTYNRNKMDCSKKYLRKAIKNTMIDNMKWRFDSNKKYIPLESLQIIRMIDGK